ncbi:carboxyl-terminal processing protease [Lachnospiraceae bacterium]|nr:carboxyl-terminal processing protease [Lachnospiraceae bacterium]
MKKLGFGAGCITGLLAAAGLLLLVFFGNAGFNLVSGKGFKKDESSQLLSRDVQNKLSFLNEIIDAYYVNYKDDEAGMTDEERIEGIYKGLVDSLNDPYSEYYTEEEYKQLSEATNGSFQGIGATLSQNEATGENSIVGFTAGSPAEASGLEVGDIFYKVDGEPVGDMKLTDLVKKVRGKEGTQVTLTMLRGEDRHEVEFTVTRQSIDIMTVSSNMIDKDTGYMILGQFDAVTPGQFHEGLENLKKQGMKKFILDLRGNPGGNLDACVEIADELLPDGRIVYTLDKAGNEKDYDGNDGKALNMPLVVLVDGNSASASEILAGAIKDTKAGVLVGSTTFGKGIVQNVYGIGDGSAIKITAAKYYTPNGVNIQGTGIEPDVKVDFDSEKYLENRYDNQLEEAKKQIKKMK